MIGDITYPLGSHSHILGCTEELGKHGAVFLQEDLSTSAAGGDPLKSAAVDRGRNGNCSVVNDLTAAGIDHCT